MKKNNGKKSLIIALPLLIIGAAAGAFKLYSVLSSFFRNEKRRKNVEKIKTAILWICSVTGAVSAVLGVLYYVLRRKDRYLFNFFDRDGFDAVDEENEDEISHRIKNELACDNDPSTYVDKFRNVPHDIDATADNLG